MVYFLPVGVRNILNSSEKDRQITIEAQNLSLKEIARRKLHHGDGCFQNLFGGPYMAVPGDLHLLIVHWDSFRLTSEPVHFPPIQLRAELEKEGLADRLVHLRHG